MAAGGGYAPFGVVVVELLHQPVGAEPVDGERPVAVGFGKGEVYLIVQDHIVQDGPQVAQFDGYIGSRTGDIG